MEEMEVRLTKTGKRSGDYWKDFCKTGIFEKGKIRNKNECGIKELKSPSPQPSPLEGEEEGEGKDKRWNRMN